MWNGGCGTESNPRPYAIVEKENYTFHHCLSQCNENEECGYFEYCFSGLCQGRCKVFSKASMISSMSNESSSGQACYKAHEMCSVKWAPLFPVYTSLNVSDSYFFYHQYSGWGTGSSYDLVGQCSRT